MPHMRGVDENIQLKYSVGKLNKFFHVIVTAAPKVCHLHAAEGFCVEIRCQNSNT